MADTKCKKCQGGGTLTNEGKPWQDADRVRVRAGELIPLSCPDCRGTGENADTVNVAPATPAQKKG